MSGVNATLGLPIIRTSVDHGVAYGKAGEGRANPQSLIEAIKLAVEFAKRIKEKVSVLNISSHLKKNLSSPKFSVNCSKVGGSTPFYLD